MYKTLLAIPRLPDCIRRVPIQLVAVLAIAASARAVELRVDFGVADDEAFESATPNDVQAGFSDFSVTPTQDGIGGIVDLSRIGSEEISRVFSGVTVTVSSVSISEDVTFFDGPEEIVSLGDLAEDGVLGGVMFRLTDLPAGPYEMTTYHYASDLLVLTLSDLSFDILLDTGSGESLVASDVSPSQHEVSIVAIPFTANGAQDVIMRLDGGSPWINGFTLVPVPEPASWLLLGSGIGAILGAAWARRRQRRNS